MRCVFPFFSCFSFLVYYYCGGDDKASSCRRGRSRRRVRYGPLNNRQRWLRYSPGIGDDVEQYQDDAHLGFSLMCQQDFYKISKKMIYIYIQVHYIARLATTPSPRPREYIYLTQ